MIERRVKELDTLEEGWAILYDEHFISYSNHSPYFHPKAIGMLYGDEIVIKNFTRAEFYSAKDVPRGVATGGKRGLDKGTKIVLSYEVKELKVVRCFACGGIIGEKLTGTIVLKCKHCGQIQEITTA